MKRMKYLLLWLTMITALCTCINVFANDEKASTLSFAFLYNNRPVIGEKLYVSDINLWAGRQVLTQRYLILQRKQ